MNSLKILQPGYLNPIKLPFQRQYAIPDIFGAGILKHGYESFLLLPTDKDYPSV